MTESNSDNSSAIESTSNGCDKTVEKGFEWGVGIGAILGLVIIFLIYSNEFKDLNFWSFFIWILKVVFTFLLSEIIGGILGYLMTGVALGIIAFFAFVFDKIDKKSISEGFKWGFATGGSLGVILALMESLDNSLSPDANNFIFSLLFYFLVIGMGGGILGGLIAGIFVGAIGIFTFISGTLLSFATVATATLTSAVVGWISIALVTISLIIKAYLQENAPEWVNRDTINKAINGAVAAFLLRLFYTLLTLSFEKITGHSLLSP